MSGHFQDGRSENPPEWYSEARASARIPATLLIVAGFLNFLLALLMLTRLDALPRILEQHIAEVEADPNLNQQQKDEQIEFLTSLKELAEDRVVLQVYYLFNVVCSVIVVLGGISMFRLSGPVIPSLSAVLVMLPGVLGCCCAVGVPVGIWTIVFLCRSDIRAAMERNALGDADENFTSLV